MSLTTKLEQVVCVCVKYTAARVTVRPIDHSTHNTEETGERYKKHFKHGGGGQT